MRILLVTHQFFPEFQAGTEVLVRSVLRGLVRRGHEVAVFTGFPDESCRDDEARADEYPYEHARVFRFRHSHRAMGGQRSVVELGYRNELAAACFGRALEEFRPDLVHIFNFARLGIGIVDEACARSIPVVFTPTDFWAACPTAQLTLPDGRPCPGPSRFAGNCLVHLAALSPGRADARWASRLPPVLAGAVAAGLRSLPLRGIGAIDEVIALSRREGFIRARLARIDRVLAPTHPMAEALERAGVDPARIERLPYGIERGEQPVSPWRWNPGTEPLRLGFVGTLAPHKGLHVLLEAFAALAGHRVQLLVYGVPGDDESYARRMQERIESLPGAEFLGRFPSAEIHRVMSGLHLLVVPSVWQENAPLVVLAALAAGRPVIGSDMPGLAELIESGHNGMRFEAGSVPALLRALSDLLGAPDSLRGMAANCRAPLSAEAYVERLLDCYARLGAPVHRAHDSAGREPAGHDPAAVDAP